VSKGGRIGILFSSGFAIIFFISFDILVLKYQMATKNEAKMSSKNTKNQK